MQNMPSGPGTKPCRSCGITGMHACPGPPICPKCKYRHAPQNRCGTGMRYPGANR